MLDAAIGLRLGPTSILHNYRHLVEGEGNRGAVCVDVQVSVVNHLMRGPHEPGIFQKWDVLNGTNGADISAEVVGTTPISFTLGLRAASEERETRSSSKKRPWSTSNASIYTAGPPLLLTPAGRYRATACTSEASAVLFKLWPVVTSAPPEALVADQKEKSTGRVPCEPVQATDGKARAW